MTTNHKDRPAKSHETKNKKSPDRHAANIPSEQDRPWVSEEQLPQQQFDKEEYDEELEKKKKKK